MRRSILFLLIIIACRLFLQPPPLLDGIDFSQAIYDDQHNLLRLTLSKDDKYRLYTPLEEISPLLIEATLLQEDQYFFQHPGINLIAILKAGWQTYLQRGRQFGASTITMQVARIRYGICSKHILGKFWQMVKALQLEFFYSKKQILEAYLNLASYGGNIEGVGAASAIYLGKSAIQINLCEALNLTVVPQNPRRRIPFPQTEQLWHRWIKKHPEDTENYSMLKQPLQLYKKHLPFFAPHFVDRILSKNRQLAINSTLNLEVQLTIESIVSNYLKRHDLDGINNAAVMLVDTRNMEVKALIGSGDFFNKTIQGQVNGTKSKRSPGSTLKPFIYALALDQGLIHPCSVLNDAPANFSGYSPENFDRSFLGPIKAKEALILSRNIPALFLAGQLKNPTLYHFLKEAHITQLKPEENYGLSLALGGAEITMQELVGLYAMLANGGLWHPLRTLANQPLADGQRLLSAEASFLTLDMLHATPRPYPNNSAIDNQKQVYWKTGTSSGYRDAWSIGVFGPYVLAVWIGDFASKSNPAFVGATAAAPLFFKIIEVVNHNLPEVVRVTPEMNLTKMLVCEISGLLPASDCLKTIETWFIPGKSPIKREAPHCKLEPNEDLHIISPKKGLIYTTKPNSRILLRAAADGEIETLYWFIDQQFIGTSESEKILEWQAKPGKYALKVVDNLGRSTTQELIIEGVQASLNRND